LPSLNSYFIYEYLKFTAEEDGFAYHFIFQQSQFIGSKELKSS